MKARGAKRAKFREGDIMRVKETGALVRLVASQDLDDDSLIDSNGHVYVEPVEATADWYHISELERVRGGHAK